MLVQHLHLSPVAPLPLPAAPGSSSVLGLQCSTMVKAQVMAQLQGGDSPAVPKPGDPETDLRITRAHRPRAGRGAGQGSDQSALARSSSRLRSANRGLRISSATVRTSAVALRSLAALSLLYSPLP